SELMEYIRDLAREDAVIRQPPQRLFEGLPLAFIGAVVCRNLLSQQLRELADLEQARRRIVAKIPLCQCAQLDQFRILLDQEAEVWRCEHSPCPCPEPGYPVAPVFAMSNRNATACSNLGTTRLPVPPMAEVPRTSFHEPWGFLLPACTA